MIDCNGTSPTKSKADSSTRKPDGSSNDASASSGGDAANPNQRKREDGDDVFSDSEGEETGDRKSGVPQANSRAGHTAPDHASNTTVKQMGTSARRSESSQQSGSSQKPTTDAAGKSPLGQARNPASSGAEDIRAIAADASVFSFGDEDFDSE